MNISSSLLFPFYGSCDVCIMQITTKKLFYYANILIYLFLWVFWIVLCIFCKKEGLWDCYICITHKILKTYFLRWHLSIVLQDMFYWNISWHWILTISGIMMKIFSGSLLGTNMKPTTGTRSHSFTKQG
jgi:hypothetical protein